MALMTTSLPEVCKLVTDGTHDSPKLQPFGVPFIKGKHISSGRIDFDNSDFITEEDHAKCVKRVKPQPDDVLFSNIGSVGDAARVTDEIEFSIKNVALFRPNPEKIDPQYFYYLVISPYFRGHFLNVRSGSAQPFISLENFRSLKFKCLRDRGSQKCVAFILSVYDDLIENNRRRIQLLEQAARLLYKEWFVHLRFPGHEHVKITDGVPDGWEKIQLGDVLSDLQSGNRPKGGAQPEGIPSIGAENVIGIGRYEFSKEKYVPEDYFITMRKGVIKSRDVVVYKDGANIGRSSYFGDGFPHERCCVNEHVFILRALPEVGQNFLYFWVEQDETRQRIANLNANTAQPGVSQSKLKTLEFMLPQKSIAALFNETVEPMVKQVFLLAKQIRALTEARDLLLPRLMDGEIAV